MTKLERTMDYGERFLFVLLITPFILNFLRYMPSHPWAIGIFLSEVLTVVLILVRRPGVMAIRFYPMAVAFLGTALPLLARPGGIALVPTAVSSALMFGGLFISISSKVSLNRSFGLIAANRGVKSGGPYRFVRHPMYLGYIVTQLGFMLSQFSWHLMTIYSLAWCAQILRIIEEERILMQDEGYRKFAETTPRRLLPGF